MIGELDHIYYWVRDMDAAVAFYRDVLGLSLIRRDGDEWAEFDAGPVRLALHGVEGRGTEAAPPSSGSTIWTAPASRCVTEGPASTTTWGRSKGSRASPRCETPTATRCG